MGVVAVFLFKGFATVIFFEGLATLIFGVISGKSSWKSTRYFSINRLKLIRDHSVLIRSILGILLIVDNAQQITWINAQKTPLFSSNHRFQMKINTKIHGNFEWSVSRFEEFRRASGRRKKQSGFVWIGFVLVFFYCINEVSLAILLWRPEDSSEELKTKKQAQFKFLLGSLKQHLLLKLRQQSSLI